VTGSPAQQALFAAEAEGAEAGVSDITGGATPQVI